MNGCRASKLTITRVMFMVLAWIKGRRDQGEKECLANMLNCKLGECLANMLNCKLGAWPLKYLGIPIAESRLGSSAFNHIKQKMVKKIDPWKGKHLSAGGKLVLTNSCLSSLPIYTMNFYLLPKGFHHEMDSVRGNFFWQGAQDVFKYHMASWITLSRPKDQGGLGIINTQIMNECLLTKWIWKIHQQPDEVWYKLLKAKYMRHKSFFKSHSRGAS